MGDLWLEEGDVITIPSKKDKVELSDYPFKIGVVYKPGRTARRIPYVDQP